MKQRLPLLILFAVLAVFAGGLMQLFRLRFEAGNVYPQYSSLRTDPLGAKALYESLDSLVPVNRNYQDIATLGEGRQTALLLLGQPVEELRFHPDDFRQIESFVGDGGRLIIALLPDYESNRGSAKSFAASPVGGPGGRRSPPATRPRRNSPDGKEDGPAEVRRVSASERWGFAFGHADLNRNADNVYQPARMFRQDSSPLPSSLWCRSALFFEKLDKSWRVVYARTNGRAVLIERKYGAGTMVLSADSYVFSNEALLKDRQPELLAWFIGPSRRVIFDETHLGVEESPGISALARKYRLHGLFGALLALALLFVWKNSTSFLPPYEEEVRRDGGDAVAGRESSAGFVNLLRRNIRPDDLLGVCITEWRTSCARQHSRTRLERIQAVIDAENVLPPKKRNPIQTWQAISRILQKSSGSRVPSSEFKDARQGSSSGIHNDNKEEMTTNG